MDDDVLADTLSAAHAALSWEMTPMGWRDVERTLAAVLSALEHDDRALDPAVARLERSAPTRAISAAELARSPAPPVVRERITQIVEAVQVRRTGPPTTPPRAR